ncbi:MAG: glycosyltransferase [Candidatus Paceibacterota bacterium]|jgi:glycosyltransferase involved in cell wall biosynthesis
MKIIYLSELRLPTKNAHGFQIMNMCSAFAGQEAEILLLVPRRHNLLQVEPFDFYKLPRNFRVKKLPAIDLYPMRFIPEKISGLLLRFSFLLLARFYLLFVPHDVLYTRESFVGLLFKNFCLEVHMPEQKKRWGFRPKKYIVLNNYIKEVLVSSGAKGDSILVAPDAVDLSAFPVRSKEEARRHLGWNDQKRPIVLYCGNFKAWKGIDTVAGAVKLLPEALIVMIGATKEMDLNRIQATVVSQTNVLVEGFKPHEDIPWYLSAADVLLLPNTANDDNSKFYTSPLKLFEYMATGRPVVASNLPSLREILNESNCVFFEPDNSGSLVLAIKKLLNDENLAKTIGDQALVDVQKYTWINRAKSILNFIGQ